MKQELVHRGIDLIESPPARGRGLKPILSTVLMRVEGVAPRPGARIETAPP